MTATSTSGAIAWRSSPRCRSSSTRTSSATRRRTSPSNGPTPSCRSSPNRSSSWCDVNPFAFASLADPAVVPTGLDALGAADARAVPPPVELPEPQLRELYDYAMSFVERNDRDLMETLFAINLTLFREYRYVPGSTTPGDDPVRGVHAQDRGLPGLRQPVHLHGPPARHPGALCLRLRLHRQPRRVRVLGRGRTPTPHTPGSSSTSPKSAGRGSTRPTAPCRAPTTSGSPTGGTSVTPRPPRGPSSRPARSGSRCTSTSRSRRSCDVEGPAPMAKEPFDIDEVFRRLRRGGGGVAQGGDVRPARPGLRLAVRATRRQPDLGQDPRRDDAGRSASASSPRRGRPPRWLALGRGATLALLRGGDASPSRRRATSSTSRGGSSRSTAARSPTRWRA